MTLVRRVPQLPEGTMITDGMRAIDYQDVYRVDLEADAPIQTIVDTALKLPGWIVTALRLRHHLIARPFGLDTGRFDRDAHGMADVPVVARGDDEIVLGQDDKHLYYRLSFLKRASDQGTAVYLSTVVRFHNVWGRVYFLPVRLGHKLVVRSTLKKLARSMPA